VNAPIKEIDQPANSSELGAGAGSWTAGVEWTSGVAHADAGSFSSGPEAERG